MTYDMRKVPLRSFKEGTYAPGNIYARNGDLLARKGTLLSGARLDRIKRLNKNSSDVYTTGIPLAALTVAKEEMETRRLNREEATGYTENTQNTNVLLNNISENKTIELDLLNTAATGVSKKLNEIDPSIILSLVNALAPVDEYLQRHCVNTAFINGLIGKWMGLSQEKIDRLSLIGLLHDCGKALIPPSILGERRRLTLAEFEVIKTHPGHSYDLLDEFDDDVRRAARGHHEKMNGEGYPDGLKEKEIPIEARITAISDIFDAIVAQRAYKDARSPFSAMAIIKKLSETELDARLVEVFIKNMPSELIGKQVLLSDGQIAIIKAVDLDDIEYPIVSMYGRESKTTSKWFCKAMY